MAAPQTTVTLAPDIGVPGQIPSMDGVQDAVVNSKTSKEASASIPFGVMVKQGTLDDDILIMTAAVNKLAGVTCWAQDFARPSELDANGIRPGTTVGVVFIGPVLVVVEDAVTPSSSVRIRHTTGAGGTVIGSFRGTAEATHTIDATGFARYLTSAGAGGIAAVYVDLANAALAVAD